MGLVTEICTNSLPTVERFDYWRNMTVDTLIPNMLRSDHALDFQAKLCLIDLGVLTVSAFSCPSLESWRSAKLIRQSDPELYQVVLCSRGVYTLTQGGRSATGSGSELILADTSRPWHIQADVASKAEAIYMQLPRHLLPLPEDKVRSMSALRLGCRRGMGGLLAGFLRQMAADAHSYTPADASRLAAVTIDLLAAVCAHHLEAERLLPPETHHHALLLRIRAFIQQNLPDPGLTPQAVATAHNISARHLHRLFQAQGLTVAGWIRQRRLENCHRDLTDPRQSHRTAQAIAARWGFTDKAHFSRLFRATYGMPPGDLRRRSTQNQQVGPTA
ncbi:helix-turn-helix domain-containing protein [Streptomyces sp. FXJ1.4098]|uniref:helix-turn-helix domain-containing protein n=1 Tax=Streptomyces sp. NPDC020845 TaxID=3365096 RepID=UPI00299BB99D|nr:helix-turn-helix domain-containing protein [Streptomyces sp. FXJ1.4098]